MFFIYIVSKIRRVLLKKVFTYFLFLGCLAQAGEVLAQSAETKVADTLWTKNKIIQFSGLVVGGDSLYGIPYVTIFVPKSGRGTVTSSVGYFSLPVIKGDSVVIKALGFKEKNLIIPESPEGKLSVIIELKEDSLLMPSVEIMPWPTERIFKEALLSLKLPHQDLDNLHKNLNEQVMKRMLYTTAPDGATNHKYFMQQQMIRQENKMTYDRTIPNLTNPFAWKKFITQVKRGELKNKADDYVDEEEEEDKR